MRKMDKFEIEKLVQVLNFFAIKNGGKIGVMKAIKLLFFTDRYHIRKYGRPVVWSTYFAMKYGPVSSEALDLSNGKIIQSNQKEIFNSVLNSNKEKHELRSLKEIDRDVFSETDIEALNFAWENFKNFDQFKLANITHAYPEWKKYEKLLKTHPGRRQRIDFKDLFSDGDDSDKELLKETLGTDPFENTKSPVAEFELEEEKEARQILDC